MRTYGTFMATKYVVNVLPTASNSNYYNEMRCGAISATLNNEKQKVKRSFICLIIYLNTYLLIY